LAKKLAWSFSALSVFETCRKKFYHLKIAKDVKDGDSEAAAEGKAKHDALYNYIFKDKPLPINMRTFAQTAKAYKDRIEVCDDAQGELKLCLNDKFEPVEWFARTAWVRAVVDFLLIKGRTAILVDWKTGKRKDDFTQLELSAAILSRYMPEIEEFHLVFEWLQDGDRSSPEYGALKKEDMKAIWMEFLPRVNEIEEARKTTEFPANPSGLCGWCPVENCPHWFDRSNR
jgi:hypothetical protein